MVIGLIADTHWGFNAEHNKLVREMLTELSKRQPNIILHSGDIGSHRPKQGREFWKTYRSIPGLETIPTVAVLGNHDYWHKTLMTARSIHQDSASAYNINLLEGTGYIFNDCLITGTCGWYHNIDHKSTDAQYIIDYNYYEFRNHATRNFQKCLSLANESNTKTKILLTHFNFIDVDENDNMKMFENPRHENFIQDFNYIVSGHRHETWHGIACGPDKKQKYYNCGSNYNQPRYLVIEI